ncbi:hypothetical protein D3C78_1312300 [compost metagenome]
MCLNNRAADREPHPQAFRLGRIKGVENPHPVLGLEPAPRISYRDPHAVRITHVRFYLHYRLPLGDRTHGIDGIHHEVQDHLLQLHSIRHYRREACSRSDA